MKFTTLIYVALPALALAAPTEPARRDEASANILATRAFNNAPLCDLVSGNGTPWLAASAAVTVVQNWSDRNIVIPAKGCVQILCNPFLPVGSNPATVHSGVHLCNDAASARTVSSKFVGNNARTIINSCFANKTGNHKGQIFNTDSWNIIVKGCN